MPQRIVEVAPHSLADRHGVRKGDALVSINDTPVLDQVDYQYLVARKHLTLRFEREGGGEYAFSVDKADADALGLTLESTLMTYPKTCANHCMFCFIEQMPPGMRPSLYVRDDDWRLSLIAGNFVTLTNLPPAEMQRIIDRKASPIYISVHTTDPELRCRMLHHRQAGRIMEHLRRFAQAGIHFHCQIVLCPGINDGEALERTLSDLTSLCPAALTAALVPVGLTKYREELYPLRPYTQAQAQAVIDQANRWRARMLQAHGTRFVFPSDEFYQIAGAPIPAYEEYEDFPQIENGVGLLRQFADEFETALRLDPDDAGARARRIVMATGVSVAPFMRALVASHPIAGVEVSVQPIRNCFFGETVTVSGLITGQDLVAQLQGAQADEIFITQSMLRAGEDVFLDDMTLAQAEQALRIPIRPVPDDGAELLYALRGWEE